MTVISITITESDDQILSGIPRSIILSTNIPSTIFYTLDGTDPTIFSTIYTSTIYLPTDLCSVTFKAMASNGVIYSPIITEIYETNMLQNARLAHSATDTVPGTSLYNLYPLGSNAPQPNSHYLSPGEAGITVDNPDLTQISGGYDGYHTPNQFTNEPYTIENYNVVYSTSDAEGQTGHGIGNIPGEATIQQPIPAPEEATQFTTLFDPRAFVIFQDMTQEIKTDPPVINREFFSLEDPERIRDGNSYFNAALDAPPTMGSFLRSHYNPRDNTITYYYFDSHANRWIISKTLYTPSGSFDGNLAEIKPGRNSHVYEWLPFTKRTLF